MNTTNETITLGNNMGLEIDFTRIVYKDATFSGPSWFTAHIPATEIRTLCGKDGNGYLTITEDEVEAALFGWLAKTLKGEVASFRWMWDTYRIANAA